MRKQFRRDGKKKHIFAMLVAFVMVFFLAACGKDAPGEAAEVSSGASAAAAEKDSDAKNGTKETVGETSAEAGDGQADAAAEAGSYRLYEMTSDGEIIDNDFLESVGMEPYTMMLSEDGTGWLKIEDKAPITWKDGIITVDGGAASYTYALSGDRITLTGDGGDTITFERTGDFPQEDEDSAKTLELAEDEPVTEMEGDEEETAYQHYWNGGWYGWSGFTNGTGLYSDVDGVYCDCMARIWIDADGRGTLVLWDEGMDLSWPLADVDVSVSDSGYDMGKMKSMSGRYLDMALGIADWLIAPDDLGYENLICIEGTYTDPTDTFSTYDYQFFLRPWGLDWSDIEADYPGGVPYYYETWYLPAIEAGIPMPDAIGGGDFLAPGEVPEEEMEAQEG